MHTLQSRQILQRVWGYITQRVHLRRTKRTQWSITLSSGHRVDIFLEWMVRMARGAEQGSTYVKVVASKASRSYPNGRFSCCHLSSDDADLDALFGVLGRRQLAPL